MGFIIGLNDKYLAVKYFVFKILSEHEHLKGDIVTADSEEVRKHLLLVKDLCNAKHYAHMARRGLKNLIINRRLYYLQEVDKVTNEYFKAGEPFIPAVLCLSLLHQYTEMDGFKDFKDIPFADLLQKYESFSMTKEDRDLVYKHYRCASAILDRLNTLKYKG